MIIVSFFLPVIIDKDSKTFELDFYDIDIWNDTLPEPKFNQCAKDEVVGICSSGSTDKPRIVPITKQQYEVDGLDNNIQIHANLCNKDSTVNFIPLWVCIGFQTFSACYKYGATYHVLNNPWKDWPKVNPTFIIGSPNVLNGMMETDVPYENMTIRHIRTVGAPMYKDFKIKAQQYPKKLYFLEKIKILKQKIWLILLTQLKKKDFQKFIMLQKSFKHLELL